MLSEGKKKKNKNWSILMSSQDKTLLLCPVISSHGDPVSALYKYIYYFQFLVFEIIRFVVWFYVPDGTFPHLWKSSVFVSQDFFFKLLKLLFSRVYYVTVALWILITVVQCLSKVSFAASHQSICENVFIVYMFWECVFSFEKWSLIKVHWSLQYLLESVFMFIRKYLLFIVFTICVYF